MITLMSFRGLPQPGRDRHARGHGVLLRLSALLVGCGLGLTLAALPSAAQAAAAPPAGALPRPGTTVAVAGDEPPASVYYTGRNGQVWSVPLSLMAEHVPASLGGQLVGGPGVVAYTATPTTIPVTAAAVFGRGTDNQLWWRQIVGTQMSRWAPMGGVLTSQPAATFNSSTGQLWVFARGTDGAVWYRTGHISAAGAVQWNPSWASLGGRLLPGTAPAAANISVLGAVVAAVGTDRAIWVNLKTGTRPVWEPIGGRTTASPGIAITSGEVMVAFARGTDNAGWYNEFLGQPTGVAAGWHSLGGQLTSGVAATGYLNYPMINVFALGTDNMIWEDTGTLPTFSGWSMVLIS